MPDPQSYLPQMSQDLGDGPAPLFRNTEASATSLDEIKKIIEQEREARIKAEKISNIRDNINMVIGILTLTATIVFGLLTVISS